MAKVAATVAAQLHSDVGGSVFNAPSTPANQAIKNVLVAEGILKSDGTYVSGKGQTDILRCYIVPSIRQEELERCCLVRGL